MKPVMTLDAPWLSEPRVQRIMAALNIPPVEARFVGGCVRNALLERPVADIDIAVNAPPETVVQMLKAAKIKIVPTGLPYGTMTAVVDGTPFEITSLRRDVQTDGRRAVVAYTQDWIEDAHRRDFTINAFYANKLGDIFDVLGESLSDISIPTVRFIGEPSIRIREDYLRILRFYRFTAIYSHDIDAAGRKACREHITDAGFQKISVERITDEIRKLLQAENPWPIIKVMHEDNILTRLFEKINKDYVYPEITDWRHRLALLTSDRAPLRLSKNEKVYLNHFQDALQDDEYLPEALAYLYGADIAIDCLKIRSQPYDKEELLRAEKAVCPVSARDLIARGYAPGEQLGEHLRLVKKIWLKSGLQAKQKDILSQLASL